jgi:hypothetical protein
MSTYLGSINDRFGHSAEFKTKLEEGVTRPLGSVAGLDNPMGDQRVVTMHTKPALMNPTHPKLPSQYIPWKSLEGDAASAILRYFGQIVRD